MVACSKTLHTTAISLSPFLVYKKGGLLLPPQHSSPFHRGREDDEIHRWEGPRWRSRARACIRSPPISILHGPDGEAKLVYILHVFSFSIKVFLTLLLWNRKPSVRWWTQPKVCAQPVDELVFTSTDPCSSSVQWRWHCFAQLSIDSPSCMLTSAICRLVASSSTKERPYSLLLINKFDRVNLSPHKSQCIYYCLTEQCSFFLSAV